MTVNLIGPDGRRYTLDNEDPQALQDSIASGFRVETPEEPRTAGEAVHSAALDAAPSVGAAGVGLLQGVSGGLFRTTLPQKDQRELAALAEEHPIASLAGELPGMALSPLNAVGEAVAGSRAATALGRVAQKSLGGASGGALFGAGATLSDAALKDDPQVSAEKLIANAGLGALLGGAGTGIFGAIEEGAGAALSKIGTLRANRVLEDFANDAAVKATRATQGAVKKLGDQRVGELGQVLRERGHLATPDKMLESLEADIAKTGAVKGSFLDAADKGAVKPNWNEAVTALDSFEQKLSPLQREEVAPSLKKARTALEDIATDPKRGTWRDFDEWKRDLQAKAKFSRGASEDDLALGLRRQLASSAREELDRQLVPALGKDGAAFLESKQLYGLLKDAQKLAESGSKRSEGLGFKDLLFGAVLGGGHPGGLGAAIGSKFMREHGPVVVAKLADAISKSPALSATANSFAKAVPSVATRVGPYGAPLMEAASRGAAMALATHVVMAHVDPSYADTAHLAGLAPEGPEEHAASLQRAGGLAALSSATQDTDAAIDRHIEQVLKGERAPSSSAKVLGTQDFGAKRMRRDAADAHDKRAEEIRQLAGDPQALVDRVSANLLRIGPVAPGVSSALTAQANVAVQYLAKAAERPLKPGPLASDWVPTEAERHEFTQKLEAVQDPMSMLRHAAEGTLTPNIVDAVRTVYPGLAKTIGERVLMRVMSAKPDDVPYRQRLMLSLLTGVDLDGTTSQAAIASNQLANRGTKSQENAAPQSKSSGARSEMTLAARTALPQQRRELESE